MIDIVLRSRVIIHQIVAIQRHLTSLLTVDQPGDKSACVITMHTISVVHRADRTQLTAGNARRQPARGTAVKTRAAQYRDRVAGVQQQPLSGNNDTAGGVVVGNGRVLVNPATGVFGVHPGGRDKQQPTGPVIAKRSEQVLYRCEKTAAIRLRAAVAHGLQREHDGVRRQTHQILESTAAGVIARHTLNISGQFLRLSTQPDTAGRFRQRRGRAQGQITATDEQNRLCRRFNSRLSRALPGTMSRTPRHRESPQTGIIVHYNAIAIVTLPPYVVAAATQTGNRKPETTEASVALIPHKLTELRGVGPKLAARLQDYGVHSVEDLLFHLPLRYQDRTRVTPVVALRPGQEAVVEGTIKLCDIAFGRRRSLVAALQDDSGVLTLRFFHFNAAQRSGLQPGTRLRCFGQARPGRNGLELIHPEYRLADDAPPPAQDTLTPIYPTTEGIGQLQWRKLCEQAVGLLRKNPPTDLLDGVCALNFTLVDALIYLHAPPADAPLVLLQAGEHPAQLRLAFEELLAHHLSLQALRQRERSHAAPTMPVESSAVTRFLKRLPFHPTGAQTRVMQEIAVDLASPRPMLRLVQGDVGSGKTLVAATAALQAMAAGYQVAIMAPTEILAEQHLANFSAWFADEDIDIVWLSGRVKGRARRQALQGIAGHQAPLVIGTHALFQDDVIFARLGLLIVDEQHRFGVHQRLQLKAKASDWRPHQLVMTATPIPRTLSMVAYADLDCSVIDELPPGRQPITTVLVDNQRRDSVIERVAHACGEGRQAYWVCTLIEESDTLQAQAAEASHADLVDTLPGLRIGLIHGRLPAPQKAAVMQQFKAGDYDLLVATTVIEVGVDVPRASLMIIENPERLGLAQLHQLRGRVGRGSTASHCVLLYQSPLGVNGRERLQAMRESNDGFFIAEKDLALRGPGEVLGTRQTGLMDFRIARLPEHEHLLDQVHDLAARLLASYPQRVQPLIQRWTGNRQRFAHV